MRQYDLCVRVAKLLGLYETKTEKSRHVFILINFTWIWSSSLIIFGMLHNITETHSIKNLIELVIIILVVSNMYVKLFNILRHLEPLQRIHNDLKDLCKLSFDKRFRKHKLVRMETDKMLTVTKVSIGISLILITRNSIAMVVYKTIPMNIYGISYEENYGWFVFAAFQYFWTSIFGFFLETLLTTMPMILLSYAIGFLNELNKRLEFLFNSEENSEYEEIVKCVKFYESIKKFVSLVKQLFGIPLLIQIFTSIVIICFSTHSIKSSSNSMDAMKGLNIAAVTMTQNFLPCYMGQKLIDSSSKLIHTVAHSHWTEKKLQLNSKIVMITFMENLKNPIKIAFFNVIVIDLSLFRALIEKSYSLYVVLARVTSKSY